MDELRVDHILALFDSGQVEQALRELRALIDDTPEPAGKVILLCQQAEQLAALGRVPEARECFEEATQLLAEAPECEGDVLLAEADLLTGEEKYGKALAKLDELWKGYAPHANDPDFRVMYQSTQVRRGILLGELRRYREALPVLEEAASFDTAQEGDFYYYLGVCYYHCSDMERARQALLKALEVGVPESYEPSARMYLGLACYHTGAYARAKQEFEICEPRVNDLPVPRKRLLRWLWATCQKLGFDEEAERYRKLAKTS